jgi:hypothetical protein
MMVAFKVAADRAVMHGHRHDSDHSTVLKTVSNVDLIEMSITPTYE